MTSPFYVLVALTTVITLSNAFSLKSLINVTDIVCPDKGQCKDGQTCCQMSGGDYGCCPYNDAVCCPDKETCCPHLTTCSEGRCLSRQTVLTLSQPKVVERRAMKIPSKGETKSVASLILAQEVSKNDNVICPDPHWQCPLDLTCCRTPLGVWTCCLYANGNCCPDGLHCCPPGRICNSSSTACNSADGSDDSTALTFIQSIRPV